MNYLFSFFPFLFSFFNCSRINITFTILTISKCAFHSIEQYIHTVDQSIFRTFSSLNLCVHLNDFLFPFPPVPGHHHSTLFFTNLTTLDNLFVSGIIWYLSFCDWLISLSIMFSMFVHVVACIRISFLGLNNSDCMHISHFVYPFIIQWTFGLLPPLDYCK